MNQEQFDRQFVGKKPAQPLISQQHPSDIYDIRAIFDLKSIDADTNQIIIFWEAYSAAMGTRWFSKPTLTNISLEVESFMADPDAWWVRHYVVTSC